MLAEQPLGRSMALHNDAQAGAPFILRCCNESLAADAQVVFDEPNLIKTHVRPPTSFREGSKIEVSRSQRELSQTPMERQIRIEELLKFGARPDVGLSP